MDIKTMLMQVKIVKLTPSTVIEPCLTICLMTESDALIDTMRELGVSLIFIIVPLHLHDLIQNVLRNVHYLTLLVQD